MSIRAQKDAENNVAKQLIGGKKYASKSKMTVAVKAAADDALMAIFGKNTKRIKSKVSAYFD